MMGFKLWPMPWAQKWVSYMYKGIIYFLLRLQFWVFKSFITIKVFSNQPWGETTMAGPCICRSWGSNGKPFGLHLHRTRSATWPPKWTFFVFLPYFRSGSHTIRSVSPIYPKIKPVSLNCPSVSITLLVKLMKKLNCILMNISFKPKNLPMMF